MPGGRSGLYPGIEKKHQSAECKRYEAENDILRTVGRDHLLDLVRAENEGRLVVPSNEPLTSGELRKMDGDPVWDSRWEVWGLVDIRLGIVITRVGDLSLDGAVISKRLYRHKQEKASDG